MSGDIDIQATIMHVCPPCPNQWQPIETVPDEYKQRPYPELFLANPNYNYRAVGRWMFGQWMVNGNPCFPTLWMPLLPLPEVVT